MNRQSHKPLMVTCPECEGAGTCCNGHPHDPRTRGYTCEKCGGFGTVASRTLCADDCWCVIEGAAGLR